MLRTLTALFIVLTLATTGCRRVTRPAPTETTSAATFMAGEKVDVKWNGSWWKGEILAVNNAKYRIHYTGWSASWDEDVAPERVRASTTESSVGTEVAAGGGAVTPTVGKPVTAPTVASAWKAGDRVDVSWNNSWWQGQIISVNGASYRVHYVGWSSSWDETVPASRVRAATGGAKKGSG